MSNGNSDLIGTIIEDLNRERPDLDSSGMAIAGRIVFLAQRIQKRVDAVLHEYDLAQWSFDVLATLRRTGSPFRRSPTELSRSTMLSTSAMVNRLDRLESRGFIKRLPNPTDRRGLIVELTREGLELVDKVLKPRLEEAVRVSELIPQDDRKEMVRLLENLSLALEEM
jgi:DNA-binding MarR family transcriptional regulator